MYELPSANCVDQSILDLGKTITSLLLSFRICVRIRIALLGLDRLDVAKPIQFMHNPRTSHLDAVYRILRYHKSAPRKGIIFSNHGHLRLEAVIDAD